MRDYHIVNIIFYLLKQSVCDGLFNYKWNKWISIDNEYDGYDDLSQILNARDTKSNDDDTRVYIHTYDIFIIAINSSHYCINLRVYNYGIYIFSR